MFRQILLLQRNDVFVFSFEKTFSEFHEGAKSEYDPVCSSPNLKFDRARPLRIFLLLKVLQPIGAVAQTHFLSIQFVLY